MAKTSKVSKTNKEPLHQTKKAVFRSSGIFSGMSVAAMTALSSLLPTARAQGACQFEVTDYGTGTTSGKKWCDLKFIDGGCSQQPSSTVGVSQVYFPTVYEKITWVYPFAAATGMVAGFVFGVGAAFCTVKGYEAFKRWRENRAPENQPLLTQQALDDDAFPTEISVDSNTDYGTASEVQTENQPSGIN